MCKPVCESRGRWRSHLALRLISRNCTSQWKQRLDGFERGMLSWERHTDEDDSSQSMLFGDIDQWTSTVVFALHLTQRTLTLMLTEHSRSKRLSRGLPKLLNTCLTKVTLRINATQSHVPGLIGNYSSSTLYSRTKNNCIKFTVLWNNVTFPLISQTMQAIG